MTERKPYETLAFPMMDSVEAINAADWLSDGEKEMAIRNLPTLPRSDGFWAVNNNPELARMLSGLGIALFANCGDNPLKPGKAAQVIHLEVARLMDCESLLGTMSASSAKLGPESGFHPMLLGMLTQPDLPAWNEDQRLGIKFANALVTNTMTSELREAAIAAWGPQGLLSYTVMASWAWMWCSIANTIGLKWEHGTNGPAGNVSGDEAAAAGRFGAEFRIMMNKFWDQAKMYG